MAGNGAGTRNQISVSPKPTVDCHHYAVLHNFPGQREGWPHVYIWVLNKAEILVIQFYIFPSLIQNPDLYNNSQISVVEIDKVIT